MIWCFRILVIFNLVFAFQVKNIEPYHDCDQGNNTWSTEGIQGQVGRFPWLGVLRVHLNEGGNTRIAVTGAILVKDEFAIANADDVSKIPERIFREDSKAMFIPADDTPWSCKLKDFVTHPEYEYSTLNTIAIVELELEDGLMPVLPICWPEYLYNASNQLFALGYTYGNQLLEKVAYRVKYVPKSLCEDFYNRAELQNDEQIPTHYVCGLPENNTQNCEWDNGMVLAANSSSVWVLIGFGIRGPGCSTPVRFIEIYQYLPWIEQVTDNQLPDYSLRKASLPKVERKIKDIPVHHFFRADSSENQTTNKNGSFHESREEGWDRYDRDYLQPYDIERIDKDAIVIATFKNKYERMEGDCLRNTSRYLIYRESMKVMAYPNLSGIASYKLALYDLAAWHRYTCIVIRVVSFNNSDTTLYVRGDKGLVDEPDLQDETPDFLLKKYPLERPPRNNTSTGTKWKPHQYLEPRFLTDESSVSWLNYTRSETNHLFLTFHFFKEAELKLEVWGRQMKEVMDERERETHRPETSTSIGETHETSTSTRGYRRKFFRKAKVHKLPESVEAARVVETDRNFDVKYIGSGSTTASAKIFCAIVILFLILSFDK